MKTLLQSLMMRTSTRARSAQRSRLILHAGSSRPMVLSVARICQYQALDLGDGHGDRLPRNIVGKEHTDATENGRKP